MHRKRRKYSIHAIHRAVKSVKMSFHPHICANRQQFRPQCTHLTMTRVYGVDFLCESCNRPGPFGWLYRCTQDREDLIEHTITCGYTAAFDSLGEILMKNVTVRKGSPAARESRYSFFKEITPEQMAKYRPDQISTILQQREKLQVAIQKEEIRKKGASILNRVRLGTAFDIMEGFDYKKPWVCEYREECQYKVCPGCRPGAGDRSFMSLNAIADGEWPPTAATGFGFQPLGKRPVVDARILQSIGLRSKSVNGSKGDYNASEASILNLIDEQIASIDWQDKHKEDRIDLNERRRSLSSFVSTKPTCLRSSDACGNLAAIGNPNTATSAGAPIPLLWTQSPSPTRFGEQSSSATFILGLDHTASVTDDRSSNSLRDDSRARSQVLSSVLSPSASNRSRQTRHTDTDIPNLYGSELANGIELTPLLNQNLDGQGTPLTSPEPTEETKPNEAATSTMECEQDACKFSPAPLKVDDGIAVLEESVELGMPDIITQA